MPVYYGNTELVPHTKRQYYQRLKTSLWTERSAFDSHWQTIGDYMLPRRTRFWPGEKNSGGSKNEKIIDSTAKYAARTLQAGLHAGITSPARPWMRLSTPDPSLAEAPDVKRWLHAVTERMRTVFQMTNMYNTLPIVYGDVGTFGTSAMVVLDDPDELARCLTYPIGSYAVALDASGRVSVFVVEYARTVRQVVEEFGYPEGRRPGREPDWTNLSTLVKRQWDSGNHDAEVLLCWVIEKNPDAQPDRLEAKYLPWRSCHFELDSQGAVREGDDQNKLLRESGFHERPFMVPRWDITGGDSYGTSCPGMDALGDAKSLQVMQKRKAQAVEKGIAPPLVGPSYLKSQKVSALPSDITYEDLPQGMAGLRPIYEVRLEGIQHITAAEAEVRYRIQRAFFEDLFLMLNTSDNQLGADRPTAREIDERHEEKLLALGPVLERMKDELHDPMVDRFYGMMERAGLIPRPPEALEGVRLKVEYISILHQAQKLVGVTAQDRFVTAALSMAEAFPSALDRLDIDQVVEDYAEMLGVDPRLVRPQAEADAMRAQRAQQQQAMAAAEQAKTLGQAAQAAGSTDLSQDSVLSRVAEGTVQ